jgi:DNA polymerase
MATEERSAGFILYRLSADAGRAVPEYLLLDYGRHWDFAKGHVESGEDDLAAARRETAEETGIIDVTVIPGFARQTTYFFRHRARGLIRKTVVFFLGRTNATDDAVRLSEEHVGFAFLPIDAALRRVTFAGARQVLTMAHAHFEANSAERRA